MWGTLLTMAVAFTPNAPLVNPRAVAMHQPRVTVPPRMRGWQDPWEDGMRTKRESLKTVRAHHLFQNACLWDLPLIVLADGVAFSQEQTDFDAYMAGTNSENNVVLLGMSAGLVIFCLYCIVVATS